ncbi:hypothetical protein H8A95_35415 [Bradyrhizobium sp. Pear76]|nr:hypothetical protein [Bradyrhizobium oropedii]
MDLFSRKIVGWAMRGHVQVELASSAKMAIQQQHPETGLIHHSDRGVQAGQGLCLAGDHDQRAPR